MAKRKALSTKSRFEIFKRDEFTCQYCGAHPPEVVLEVDHIIPVADGGANDETNLTTACFDCNRGKSARSLSAIPKSLREKAAEVTEHEAQIRGYAEVMARQRARIEADCWSVADLWLDVYNPQERSIQRHYLTSIKRFVEQAGTPFCLDAMETAVARFARHPNDDRVFRYFCGICWNEIRKDSPL